MLRFERLRLPSKLMTFSGLVLVLQLVLCFAFANAAWAASPLAILNSPANAQNYQDQHIGTWDDDYKVFKKALDGSNVRYDELTDADVNAGPSKLSAYKLIVVPLLVDLPASEVANLQEFTRAGGKLLLTDGAGTPGAGAQSLLQLAGVASAKQVTIKEVNKLLWPRQPLPVSGEFAVASVVCQLNLAGGQSLAGWQGLEGQELGCAIARQGNVIFVGWAPGAQGEITTNAQFLSQCLDELSPGITQQAAVQISYADYQTISQELDYLAKRTDEAIKTARQAEFAVPLKEIQSKYDAALVNVQSFNSSYRERLFLEADQFLQKARQEFALAFAQAMPVRPVEARCVWLDRGTIVACRSAQGMAKLFDKLQQANINVVYFETNNAGFAMFPSKIYAQNPETLSWDPLGAACEEAHKRGMEFHAWFWIFGVGNNKHNPIVGKEADYPGPVLAGHDLTWALTSQSGALVPARQFEYWLDPSNSECRQHVKSLILEVINRYPVEGIQLDYIRYPFNNRGSEMGLNWLGRLKFERETGLSLDRLDDTTREVFVHWKAAQITSFVKEVSDLLRSQKPNIRISAAVYAMPKRLRVNAIQQEWETWVANGWVDTINPMTYVSTPKELAEAAGFVRESTADKALSYPGLSIRQLDQAGLIEQLDQSRVVGTLGTTMFAVAHLDDKKCSVLQVGPYRKAPSMTPQAEPMKASRLLFDDFANMVNSYLQDPKKRIMSDTASTNDVLSQIDSVQKNINFLSAASTPEEIDGVLHEVVALHNSIREWLRLEAFIQRGFRAQYIANYLGQVEAILSYGAKRVRTQATLGRTVAAQEAKPGVNLPLE